MNKTIILIGICMFLLIGCINKQVFDEVCKAYGFNESTDHAIDCGDNGLSCKSNPYMIECDGVVYFYNCRIDDECTEYDKWGVCVRKTMTDISCWSGNGDPLYLFHSKWEGEG